MNQYKILNKQKFVSGNFSIVPIRHEDRLDIMKWRNEQIYHLRQDRPLTIENQNYYFDSVVNNLFGQQKPNQILFSFLENEKCIGYGGLVHINWIDMNAEVSFIMDTVLEKEYFESHWLTYLGLIEKLAFQELNLHKIYIYAFDLRPHLYDVALKASFIKEAVLKEHCKFQNKFIDVVIHSKIKQK
jgi:RimJ/RimL family protein N-acetyltransferase